MTDGLVLLHGEGGVLDELVIVAVSFAVLWLAVRLGGRGRAEEDDEAADVAAREDAVPPISVP